MRKKIAIPLVLILVLGLSFVVAAWFWGYDNTIEGKVVKTGGKLEVVEDLSNFSLNTSLGFATDLQNLTLNNKKSNRTAQILIDVNKTLGESMCPDFENDCNVLFGHPNGTVVNNGSVVIIPKGLNYYQLNTTCVEFSCEQNLSIRVRFVDFS